MIEVAVPLEVEAAGSSPAPGSPAEPARDASASGPSLPVWQSQILPATFHHGFTSRAGGVSEGPFSSLNLGARWGDEGTRVAENRRRLYAAAHRPLLYFCTQVHGAAVRRVEAGETPDEVARAEADALIARALPIALGVHMADCVPVLLADPATGAFGAAHAGWRGTVAGVVPETVAALARAFGSRPEDLRLAIGPCINVCCFEVGTEVVEAIRRAWPWAEAEGVLDFSREKAHVDLPRLNAGQAARMGVPRAQIDLGGLCTACDQRRFFSYRRDHGRTGLHAAFIAGP
jgi:YfiH family protein